MTPGIHRCPELEMAEHVAEALTCWTVAAGAMPPFGVAIAISLTRMNASRPEWMLQLHGASSLTTLAKFCPFCGVKL